jgi:hypothetical protein
MMRKIIDVLKDARDRQRMVIALSKGSAAMQSRDIDLSLPVSWEASGFSQNGEDGILDILRRQLLESNKYFFESVETKTLFINFDFKATFIE